MTYVLIMTRLQMFYGFIDLQLIQNVGNTKNDVQTHLLNKVHKDKNRMLPNTLLAFVVHVYNLFQIMYH